jgi:serine/threonine protein kinase
LGTFGRVLECHDKQRDMVVAIKVVRKVEKYSESAKVSEQLNADYHLA